MSLISHVRNRAKAISTVRLFARLWNCGGEQASTKSIIGERGEIVVLPPIRRTTDIRYYPTTRERLVK